MIRAVLTIRHFLTWLSNKQAPVQRTGLRSGRHVETVKQNPPDGRMSRIVAVQSFCSIEPHKILTDRDFIFLAELLFVGEVTNGETTEIS